MLAARHFKWLPNAITSARILCGGAALVYAAQEVWVAAFWLFVIALVSDFLDGLAAKKLNAATKLGELLDSFADGWLAASGLIGLSATGHVSWWVTGAAIVLGLAIQIERRVLRQKLPLSAKVKKMFAIICLFVAWIYIVLKMAALAYGWQWWYLALLFLVFAAASLLKRHRWRAWLVGRS
jgi:Phosphatidylserine synthase